MVILKSEITRFKRADKDFISRHLTLWEKLLRFVSYPVEGFPRKNVINNGKICKIIQKCKILKKRKRGKKKKKLEKYLKTYFLYIHILVSLIRQNT